MITHAAGESGAIYRAEENGRFDGATAVVLEVKNEEALHKAATLLWHWDIPRVDIYESHGTYTNQFMAIGLVPVEGRLEILNDFQTLKTLFPPVDIPVSESVDSQNPK